MLETLERLSFNIAMDITGIFGLFLMGCSLLHGKIAFLSKPWYLLAMFITQSLMLFSDMLACIYRGNTHAIVLLYVVNSANYILSYILLLIHLDYLVHELSLRRKQQQIIPQIIAWTSITLVIATFLDPFHKQFFSIPVETGLYQRETFYFIHTAAFSCFFLACVGLIHTQKNISRARKFTLSWFFIIPFCTGIAQQFYPGISLTNLGSLLSVIAVFANYFWEQNKTFGAKELELQSAHSALVLSQIQPHFLFNSMTAIMDLCDSDPREAKAALQELSDYLHYKISAMSNTYVVPFSEDLEFLQNYLKLEKRRFGPRLRVEYNIQYTDFSIPLLTLQPMVENAIRHGISKRPEGGTILLSTKEQGEYCTIKLMDNGVGFDTNQLDSAATDHIGLSNVKNRIQRLCGGSLSIHSVPGIGTVVEITLRKGNEHDHSDSRR